MRRYFRETWFAVCFDLSAVAEAAEYDNGDEDYDPKVIVCESVT